MLLFWWDFLSAINNQDNPISDHKGIVFSVFSVGKEIIYSCILIY